MSAIEFDPYTSLEMCMDAYDVSVVSDDGQLLLSKPENRQKFMSALREFTNFYLQGYVPPAASQCLGAGNNNSLLNGEIVMTQNLIIINSSYPKTI